MSRSRTSGTSWALALALGITTAAVACAQQATQQPAQQAAADKAPARAKGEVDIVVDGNTCTVEPERVIIDYGQDRGYPTKVKFKVRKGKDQRVRILVAEGQTEPDLFGELPVFEPGKDKDEKDAAPKREPKWSPTQDFNFRYKVAVGDVICDPDICIRNGGSGCPV